MATVDPLQQQNSGPLRQQCRVMAMQLLEAVQAHRQVRGTTRAEAGKVGAIAHESWVVTDIEERRDLLVSAANDGTIHRNDRPVRIARQRELSGGRPGCKQENTPLVSPKALLELGNGNLHTPIAEPASTTFQFEFQHLQSRARQ